MPQMPAAYGFNAIADTAQFAVCYPQGMNCTWDNDKPGSKDVGFIRQLVAKLQTEHGFSPEHTFIAGFSEGGAFCNILALKQRCCRGSCCGFWTSAKLPF
ncbi:MAG UNVERIFIED_CONTAM: hypothetical protein LVR18_13520 [Planctomycetaceae bacterium]